MSDDGREPAPQVQLGNFAFAGVKFIVKGDHATAPTLVDVLCDDGGRPDPYRVLTLRGLDTAGKPQEDWRPGWTAPKEDWASPIRNAALAKVAAARGGGSSSV